jgi:hypothetical protein
MGEAALQLPLIENRSEKTIPDAFWFQDKEFSELFGGQKVRLAKRENQLTRRFRSSAATIPNSLSHSHQAIQVRTRLIHHGAASPARYGVSSRTV